jgi:hypothetical protein
MWLLTLEKLVAIVYAGTMETIQSSLYLLATYLSEWPVVSLLVTFVIGFVSGLLYALRLYKKLEVDSDREWAKRRGVPEMQTQYGELPRRMNPTLRRQRL